MKQRVVVTGLGAVTAIGTGKERFWANLVKGRSGIRRVSQFDTSSCPRHYAGEVRDFRPEKYIDEKQVPLYGRAAQFAIAGTQLALRDAGLDPAQLRRRRMAVALGVTIPEASAVENFSAKMLLRLRGQITRSEIMNLTASSIVRDVGNFFGAESENLLIPNACAAGNFSIGYACDLLRGGETDLAIVGGAEALSRIAFQGFTAMHAMAPRRCAPFSRDRKGMLLGEGAGILVLETLARAEARKAHVYAEVLGYGMSCDAHHMTIPDKDGVLSAMKKALRNAGVPPEGIDYISAHGTGTGANDKNESAAIGELFGARAAHIPVSSIKSMLGHSLGASSAIEAVACCLTIERGVIPPTINFKVPDPECPVDCVPNKARSAAVRTVLNNGFAFGGNNCCVVLGKR